MDTITASTTSPSAGRWPRDDGRRGGTFEGAELGGPVSGFVVEAEAGEGPDPHHHAYVETFVVLAGRGRFEVDGVPIEGAEGDVLVVPAGAIHRFEALGPEGLRMVAIHAAPRIDSRFVDPA